MFQTRNMSLEVRLKIGNVFFSNQKKNIENMLGGVWFVFLNNYFQFLNNILCISTHFFTHTYFHKYFQTTIFSF